MSKTKWPIGTEEKSSKYLGVTIGKRLEWKAHVVDIVSLSKPKHRQVQPLAASPYVDPAVVERAWEQKVPPCLLKGLAGLSMQSEALWRNLDTAVGEGARQVLGMHKFANGDLACSELAGGVRHEARARVQIQQFAYMWRLSDV